MEASSAPNDEQAKALRPVPPLDGDDAETDAAAPAGVATPPVSLVDSSAVGGSFAGTPLGSAEQAEDHSDLVAQVVGDSGLLAPDKLEAVRARAQGGSFSRALLDQGFAHSLG